MEDLVGVPDGSRAQKSLLAQGCTCSLDNRGRDQRREGSEKLWCEYAKQRSCAWRPLTHSHLHSWAQSQLLGKWFEFMHAWVVGSKQNRIVPRCACNGSRISRSFSRPNHRSETPTVNIQGRSHGSNHNPGGSLRVPAILSRHEAAACCFQSPFARKLTWAHAKPCSFGKPISQIWTRFYGRFLHHLLRLLRLSSCIYP